MESLLAAARNGDEAVFAGMLEPLLDEAHRLALAMLQNPHDAEEAASGGRWAGCATGRTRGRGS
jgi:DNA-directed RNA polymerase specialized sigma24 family protein